MKSLSAALLSCALIRRVYQLLISLDRCGMCHLLVFVQTNFQIWFVTYVCSVAGHCVYLPLIRNNAADHASQTFSPSA